jgi:hypothetical protein
MYQWGKQFVMLLSVVNLEKKVINKKISQYYVPIAIHSVCAVRVVKVFVRQIIVSYLHRNSALLLFITLIQR